ncbi:MAG: hypothetical protein A2X84_04190 [Desulfuromonadaceae bacterium GWC2_58_13]|nr:MAG: hypothetical protein A2X84_04190 [Desulfuromonadaceae bacterium GWC2_58_13]
MLAVKSEAGNLLEVTGAVVSPTGRDFPGFFAAFADGDPAATAIQPAIEFVFAGGKPGNSFVCGVWIVLYESLH